MPEPRLIYAQGNYMGADADPVSVGPLTVARDEELCSGSNIMHQWTHYALRFTLDQAEVVVSHQSVATLDHQSGAYEARNVAAVELYSESLGVFPVTMWGLRPQP